MKEISLKNSILSEISERVKELAADTKYGYEMSPKDADIIAAAIISGTLNAWQEQVDSDIIIDDESIIDEIQYYYEGDIMESEEDETEDNIFDSLKVEPKLLSDAELDMDEELERRRIIDMLTRKFEERF